MNRTKLEELLSAYIDDELSPQDKKKVEEFVKTDTRAKNILDSYLSVRQAFQREAGSLRYKAPAGFATSVLAMVDMATPSPKVFGNVQYKTVSRWSNPRIFAYPLAVLIFALFIGIYYRSDTTNSTPATARTVISSESPVISSPAIMEPGEPIIYAPLSGDAGTVSQPKISIQPKKTDLKLVCHLKDATSTSNVFVQVFAKHEVPWTKSTSGTNTTVYEISVGLDTLHKILDDLQAHSIEISGLTEDLSIKKPVKVFFQVE